MNLLLLSLCFLLPTYCHQGDLVVPELRSDGQYEFDCVVCAENGLGEMTHDGFQYNQEYLDGFSARENRILYYLTYYNDQPEVDSYDVKQTKAWQQGFCSKVRMEFHEIVVRNKNAQQ